MLSRSAPDVARRCLCLELLAQRFLFETDEAEPAPARETARATWFARLADLGVEAELTAEERMFLERAVGTLNEDERDDVHGRAAGASVLLWALGRGGPERPTYAKAEDLIADHGLLGDGSVSKARAAAEAATLRPDPELDGGLSAYLRVRGKAREPSDPEQIFAGIAAHLLAWVTDAAMAFDDDVDFD